MQEINKTLMSQMLYHSKQKEKKSVVTLLQLII